MEDLKSPGRRNLEIREQIADCDPLDIAAAIPPGSDFPFALIQELEGVGVNGRLRRFALLFAVDRVANPPNLAVRFEKRIPRFTFSLHRALREPIQSRFRIGGSALEQSA